MADVEPLFLLRIRRRANAATNLRNALAAPVHGAGVHAPAGGGGLWNPSPARHPALTENAWSGTHDEPERPGIDGTDFFSVPETPSPAAFRIRVRLP